MAAGHQQFLQGGEQNSRKIFTNFLLIMKPNLDVLMVKKENPRST